MISEEKIKKICWLSKLAIDENNLVDIISDLNSVMSMIDDLQEIDCDEIEPLRSVHDDKQRLVADVVREKDISEQLFRNLPEQGASLAREVRCFVVPKVVE